MDHSHNTTQIIHCNQALLKAIGLLDPLRDYFGSQRNYSRSGFPMPLSTQNTNCVGRRRVALQSISLPQGLQWELPSLNPIV